MAHWAQWYYAERYHSSWRRACLVGQLDAYPAAQSSSVLSWRSVGAHIISHGRQSPAVLMPAATYLHPWLFIWNKIVGIYALPCLITVLVRSCGSLINSTYNRIALHVLRYRHVSVLRAPSFFLCFGPKYIIPQTPILASCCLFNGLCVHYVLVSYCSCCSK